MPVIFCRIAWMNEYKGITDNDKPVNGGSYVNENDFGGEIHNFTVTEMPIDICYFDMDNRESSLDTIEVCQGYVSTRGQINIERLGASKTDDFINGILVVWLATPPGQKTRIVGWYRNATVFRNYQEGNEFSPRSIDRCDWVNVEARSCDCVLLPIEDRRFVIPRASKFSGGIGQSNIWFADKEKDIPLANSVLRYLDIL